MTRLMWLLMVSLAMPVFAVDGYKELKFGMTKQEVKNKKLCQFGDVEKDDNQLEMISCHDFRFSGGKTSGHALFIDNKLVRVAVELKDENQFVSVLRGLNEKYGRPSTPSSIERYQAVASLPNQSADVGFDDDTVYLRAISDARNNKNFILMYTVNNYDNLLESASSKANRGDL